MAYLLLGVTAYCVAAVTWITGGMHTGIRRRVLCICVRAVLASYHMVRLSVLDSPQVTIESNRARRDRVSKNPHTTIRIH